jgi:lysozyme
VQSIRHFGGRPAGFKKQRRTKGDAAQRLAAVAGLAILAACTTIEDLTPVSGRASVQASSRATVAVGYPRFNDRAPHDWRDHKPWSYAVHGADVSKYQSAIDWATARKHGISFAFIKATEGADRVDNRFAENWKAARAVGVPRGAYHFYYFCRTGEEQARWFIKNVPKDSSALPPVLDMEWNHKSPTCKLRPPAETVRGEMKAFLDIVGKHYAKRPIIYTTVDFFDRNGLSAFTDYPFWLRSVAGHPDEKYGNHPFVFWQYTGTGVVPGIGGDVDLNVFNGSEKAWREWLEANTG